MTDYRERALSLAGISDSVANLHALIYLGDQVKRIADQFEGPAKSPAEAQLELDYANLDEIAAYHRCQIARVEQGGPAHASTAKLRESLAQIEAQRSALDYQAAQLHAERLKDAL